MRDKILRWLTKRTTSNVDMLVILAALVLIGTGVHIVAVAIGVIALIALFTKVESEFWMPPITREQWDSIKNVLEDRYKDQGDGV